MRGTVQGGFNVLRGDDFAKGMIQGFMISMLRSAPEMYEDFVGYELDFRPGGDAASKGTTDMPVKGANNIGFQKIDVSNPCFACEGGWLSSKANQLPGVNAVAGVHDVFQVSMGNSIWREIFNVPGMAVAAPLTYTAFAGNILSMIPQDIYYNIETAYENTRNDDD